MRVVHLGPSKGPTRAGLPFFRFHLKKEADPFSETLWALSLRRSDLLKRDPFAFDYSIREVN